jgi:archaellin
MSKEITIPYDIGDTVYVINDQNARVCECTVSEIRITRWNICLVVNNGNNEIDISSSKVFSSWKEAMLSYYTKREENLNSQLEETRHVIQSLRKQKK